MQATVIGKSQPKAYIHDMRHIAHAALFLGLLAVAALAQGVRSTENSTLTIAELSRILRITTFRVRVPNDADHVWDIQVLKREQLKKRGQRPVGLTNKVYLLSFRDKGNDVYEFTVPERGGAFSQGDFELCKQITCEGQYSLNWLKEPQYSADGEQCVLATFSGLSDEVPSAFIALVRVRNKP